jgi:ribonucleoside-diphosphate reductase alpha chain
MIALFNLDDEDMLTCKFGNWYETDPHRARANNSAVILRHKIDKETFLNLWKKIEASGSGEPGFFFTNDKEFGLNPCAEVSLRANQFCNLTTINASDVVDQEDLNARSKAASFIGTLQAGYTNFHYLRDEWQKITEKEALIGVSMTGIASGKVLELDLKEASNIVVKENERVAKLIGINKAARCTVVKPEGTSSLVLGSSSGIHAWHDKRYLRRLRVGKTEAIYQYLELMHPELVEDEFFKPQTTAVISVPIKAPEGAITRDKSAVDLLKRVSRVYKDWVVPGHRKGANVNNVSTTVTIKPDEWEEVGEWMWDNRGNYTALSVLPYSDHSYIQAPFETITKKTFDELVKSLHEVDLDNVVEDTDETALQDNVACAAGACEIV